jgi:hypothetical protein
MNGSIAYRCWSKAIPIFYVRTPKGRVGDWEYTRDAKLAMPLTPAQQKRFADYCKAVGVTAHIVEAKA